MDRIVAIDLGTSSIRGVVGERNATGVFTVVAQAIRPSNARIKRGNIHNLNDVAQLIKDIVEDLESQLPRCTIKKVYIGVGGQSLRSINHKEVLESTEATEVTDENLKVLDEKCRRFTPDLQTVLDVVPPMHFADGHRELNPKGIKCKKLEAHYKLIVGRSTIKQNVLQSLSKANMEMAGIVISPLAIADAVFSDEDKELGCALVDFGAGITSVSVYKNGNLVSMNVIPLGGNLITRDIEKAFTLTVAKAKDLKLNQGRAIPLEGEDKTITIAMDGGQKDILLSNLNIVIEARIKEIVKNVEARIKDVTDISSLGAGIVIAGGTAQMKDIELLIEKELNVKVRPAVIKNSLIKDYDMLGDPQYMTALSLMLKGTEDCVEQLVQPLFPAEDMAPMNPKPNESQKKIKDSSKRSWLGRLGKLKEKGKDFMENMFDDAE